MKILVVCQHFYPETFRINDITFELAKKGHSVTVLTGLPNYPEGYVHKEYKWFRNRKQQINGVTIKRCSLVGRRKSTLMMGINYLWFALFGSLKAFFMSKDFDIVYVYQLSPITMSWPGIVVSRLKGIPLVIHCLDQWPISVTTGPIGKDSLLYKILTKISIWSYRKASRIIVSSKSFKRYFEEELKISAEDKGLTYYPSYAENDYENVGNIDNKCFDIVFAGNIGPAQSVETIIETANLLKQYDDIKFHIVGDGLSKESCEEKAKEYKLENVEFYGFHPVEEMPKYYALADCFIITMVDNIVVNSTLPAKVQSYMLAKKPIIGSISGEVKSVIKEAECGYCTDSGNFTQLAEIITNVYNNVDELNKMGNNAIAYYKKHFEKEKCISDLEDIFQSEIMKGRN